MPTSILSLLSLCIRRDNGKMLVLFLTSSPLHKMHLNDMYIEELGKVFDTKIWDISDLYGRGKDNPEFPEVLRVRDLQELEEELNRISEQTPQCR